MRRGELVKILAARDGSDALAAAGRGPATHVHRRRDRRLYPVALSLRRRPLRSGADRAETGLFSRVSSRRRFEGQTDRMKRASRIRNHVCTPHKIFKILI